MLPCIIKCYIYVCMGLPVAQMVVCQYGRSDVILLEDAQKEMVTHSSILFDNSSGQRFLDNNQVM